MAAVRDITLSDLAVGSVERLRATVRKDGAAWDLSSGVVTITLIRPDKTVSVTEEMVAEDAAAGVFYYDTTVDDVDAPGYWVVTVTVEDAATSPPTVKRYPYSMGFYASDPGNE